nr:Gag-Pol polyprotein [Tanacetum cinerariifolium]
MSRDVITVGLTMRISLLYRGEYSQWHERFMNYLEEQMDGEAMIYSIQNGDHPLPVVAQVSLVGTAQNAIPTLKDPNNKIAKDLWDALERQMRGSKYGEQDRRDAILYEYETFKATGGEQLLDTYLRYLQVINDLKKCGYKKDNSSSSANKKPEYVKSVEKKEDKKVEETKRDMSKVKFYNCKKERHFAKDCKKAKSANKKQEFFKTDTKKVEKKDDEKKRDMSRVKCYNCKKEGHFGKDCKKAKVKDYEYYKTKILLAKKDKDEQGLLAEDQAWIESSSDSNQEINANMKDSDEQVLLADDKAWMESSCDSDKEINANMVFMAQIEKVLLDSEESSSSAKETIAEDHPLEQLIRNPLQSVRTRRQLESDVEMCMFALTVSRTEPKNIKEAMADSAWIESMQEELHQFDRLDVWELVDRPLSTNVINLKWLWKNKRDEENTV